MNDAINFAWPVTSVNREDYLAFESWFSQNRKMLEENAVIIWGAGIRGTEFSLFFKKLLYTNVCFTDSNAEKWGGRIDEFPIISIDDADARMKEGGARIIVSTENSQQIEQVLEIKGYQKDKDYFIIKTELYQKYLEEYAKELADHALIMSDCEFLTISVHDTNWDTLEDMIKKKDLGISVKCLAMHGMGLRSQYMILREQMISGRCPKVLGVMINFDTLTGKQHLLPRSQHMELFKLICENCECSKEFEEYFHLTEQRSKNLQIEFLTGRRRGEAEDIAIKSKNYFKINYLYRLDTETEGIVYLKKIVKLAQEYEVKTFFFIPPINYVWGREVVGETFDVRYKENIRKIYELLKNESVIDFSYMFTPDFFAEPTTPDETVNEKGREAMAKILCDEIVSKGFEDLKERDK